MVWNLTLQKVIESESEVAQLCLTLGDPMAWDSPGRNTGVGCRFLLQRIFPTQGSNPGLLHCRQTLLLSEPPGAPKECCKWHLVFWSESWNFIKWSKEKKYFLTINVSLNWCFQTVVLEKTFESPLDSKEIKLVSPKGNQPWIVIGRTDAEAEAPILWSPDMNSRLIG